MRGLRYVESPLTHEQAAARARAYATRTVAAAARRQGKQGPPLAWTVLYFRRYRYLTGRPLTAGPRPVMLPARKMPR